MQKFLQRMMFLVALLVLPWAMQAQESIPYTQGFESSSVPTGWQHIGNGSTATSTTYAHGGSNSLKFSGATSDNVEVFPEFDSEISTLEVTLWMRPESFTSSSCGSFDVGYVTTASSASTFVAVATYNYDEFSAFAEISFAAPNAPAGSRFALRHRANSTAWYWFVDDVDVHTIPSCYKPLALSAENLTSTTADITWVGPAEASSWIVEYNDANFVPGTGEGTTIYATDTVVYLTDLTANTFYHVYVHADCGGGDTSINSYFVFRTLPGGEHVTSFPYVCDFGDADENANWIFLGTATNQWAIGSAVAADEENTNSLYITDDNGVSNNYDNGSTSYAHALRMVDFTAGQYAIQYTWKGQGESRTYDFTRAFIISASETISENNVPGSSTYGFYNNTPTNWINLYDQGGYKTMSLQSTWSTNQAIVTIPSDGTYYLAFIWANDASGGNNPPTAIDNIVINELTCPQPTNIVVTPSENEATFTWTAGEDESQWLVICNGEESVVYDNNYTITDLNPNTPYSVSIAALCSSSDTSFFTTASFRTTCGLLTELPYFEDFESQETGSSSTGSVFVPCWVRLNNGTTSGGYPYVSNSTTYNHTSGGSKGLYWYNYTTTAYGDYLVAVLPAIDTDMIAMNAVQLRLWARTSSSSYNPVFYVGVMGNPDSVNTFQPIDTIALNGNTTWTEFEIPFGSFEGYGANAAIYAPRSSSLWYMYMDDITLELIPACPHVTDLDYSFTEDGVEVTWTEMGEATAWQVYASTTATSLASLDADDAENADYAYEESFVFDNLVSGTTYYIYVRPDCGGEGPWFGPIAVTPGSVNIPAVGTATVTGCGLVIYDDGGINGDYSTYCDGYMVVTAPYNDSLLNFYGSVITESTSYDYLVVYEGVGVNGTVLYDQRTLGAASATIDTINAISNSITIYFHSDVSNQYAGFEIHTFCTAAPDCGDVVSIDVEAGPNSALVSWTPSTIGEYTGATVEYREASASSWTTVGTTNDTYIGITGLDTLTDYEVRVQANCQAGDAGWVLGTFSTPSFSCRTIDTANSFTATVGTGTTGSYYLPLNNYYNYSFTEELYTAEEIDGFGTINSIEFQYTGSSPSSVKNDCQIYMATTTSSTITSTSYLEPSQMTLVYTGSLNATNGWNTYTLDQPFNYANGNLLIAVVDNSGDYDGSTYTFATHTASNKCVYYYDDSYMYSAGEAANYTSRPNIKINAFACSELETCPAPIARVESATTNSVTLAWVPGNTETSWNVYYRATTDDSYTLAGTATANNYTVSNLSASSLYDFMVTSICGSTEGGAAQISGWTECGATPVPYFIDFESEAFGPFSRHCWESNSTFLGTDYPYPNVVSLTGDPNKLLLLYNGAYLVLPEFNAPLNTLQARFTFVQGGDNVRLMLGLLENLDDPISTIQPIDTLIRSEIDPANQSINIAYPLDMLPATTQGHLVFYDAWSDNYSFIDNLYIEPIPSCMSATNVTASDITDNSADIEWESGCASTTSYIVEYGERNFALGTGTTLTTSSTSFTLTGLNAGTSYDVYVYALCGNDTAIVSNPARFMTECGAVTLPYFQNFDNVLDAGSTDVILPNCWSFTMTGTGSYAGASYYPGVYNSTSYSNSGEYCLRLYGNAITVLPEMPVSVDSLILSFHEYNTSPSYYGLIVGAVDSITPGFEASFVPIDTLHYGSGYTYDHYIFLTSYQGTGHYIAFKNYYNGSSQYSYHYIDDLLVELIPSCIYPMNFSTVSATTTSADIAWTTSNASDYEYEYGPTGFTQGTGTTGNCTGQLAQISGLTIGTTYDIYVRGICSAGDTSDWKMYTFSTLNADPATLPYSCDFTDTTLTNSGFEFVNDVTNRWYFGNVTSNGNANSIYISNDNGLTTNYTISSTQFSYAYRDIVVPEGELAYSFDWSANGESYYDYLRVWLAPISASLVAGTAPDGTTTASNWDDQNPANWYPLDGGAKLNLSSSWQTRNGEITVAAGTYHLVFMWANDGSSGTPPAAAVDNIFLAMNTCPKPTNIHATNATTSEITIDWTDVATPSSWIVRCANGNTSTDLVATSHPFTITNLDALTSYSISVRPICSGNDTGLWAGPVLISTTMCDAPVYAYNYDTASTSSVTSSYVPAYAFYNHSFSQTIIDSVDLASLEGMDITAFAFKPSTATAGDYYTNCEVWLMPTERISFSGSYDFVDMDATAVRVFAGDLNYDNTDWQVFGFDTAYTWTGNGNLILTVVRNDGSYLSGCGFEAVAKSETKAIYGYSDTYTVYPDDLSNWDGSSGSSQNVAKYQLISCGVDNCRKPVIANVNGNYASATMTWTSSASSFEVAYKATTDGDWSTSVAVDNAYTYTFTGLTPNTAYLLRVRALCNEGEASNWAVANFTTEELPCFAPTNVAANTAFTSASFTWTAGGEETHWTVRVWNTTFDTTYAMVSAPSFTANGLTPEVTYNAAVRAMCGTNGEVPSENWSDTISFTTVGCDVVSNVAATVNGSTATITWTPGSNNNGAWEVRYGLEGFTNGEQIADLPATTNSLTINNLQAYRTYDVYVRAKCADGVYSNWSTKISFYVDQVGIHTAESDANVAIYPNPASGSTTISLAGVAGQVSIAIVDMNGRTIRTDNMECDGNCVQTINVDGLAQGAYFVRVSSDNFNAVKKLIVK